MPEENKESTGLDNKHSNLRRGEEGVRTGMGIANDVEETSAQISDDSRNMVAEQDHHGSDNAPDTGRTRNAP